MLFCFIFQFHVIIFHNLSLILFWFCSVPQQMVFLFWCYYYYFQNNHMLMCISDDFPAGDDVRTTCLPCLFCGFGWWRIILTDVTCFSSRRRKQKRHQRKRETETPRSEFSYPQMTSANPNTQYFQLQTYPHTRTPQQTDENRHNENLFDRMHSVRCSAWELHANYCCCVFFY